MGRIFFVIFLCGSVLFQSCSGPTSIVDSDPVSALEKVPGGFRYQFTKSSKPVIYQAPIQDPVYVFESCDSLIGKEAYESMFRFMKEQKIEGVIISEDA